MLAEEEDVENIVLTPKKANDDDELVDDNKTGLSQKKVSIAASLNFVISMFHLVMLSKSVCC